jgi:hypothetical protein
VYISQCVCISSSSIDNILLPCSCGGVALLVGCHRMPGILIECGSPRDVLYGAECTTVYTHKDKRDIIQYRACLYSILYYIILSSSQTQTPTPRMLISDIYLSSAADAHSVAGISIGRPPNPQRCCSLGRSLAWRPPLNPIQTP